MRIHISFLRISCLVVVSAPVLSCSLLIDASPKNCSRDADCAALSMAGVRSVCGAEGVCIKGPDCTTNLDCLGLPAPAPQPSICRKSDQKCVPLQSAQCVYKAEKADLEDDNTLWFGIVSQRMSAPHMEAGAELVRQQMVKLQNLPPATITGKRRPMGFVSCTTDMMQLEKGLDHLINTVQVPAIIGSNSSGDVVTMLSKYTLQAGVLTLSPSASAPNISDIDSKGLFFRMCGTDTIAVKSLAFVLKNLVEPQLRAPPPAPAGTVSVPVVAPGEQLSVAVMHKEDTLGVSLANAAPSLVEFNGKPALMNGSKYKVIPYGDPGALGNDMAQARYAAAAADALAFLPHVIFVFGSLEFSTMAKMIEARWPKDLKYRPVYLVLKGVMGALVTDVGTNEDWARRIYGAQPYVDKKTLAYGAFEQAFRGAFKDIAGSVSITATPSYFDAAYVLAYAVVANGANPVTGANLGEAIRTRLTPAPPPATAKPFSVGFDNVFAVVTALGNGERVDIQGLTGNLDFARNGDVNQTQEIVCLQTEPGPGGTFGKVVGIKSSGMIYDPTLGMVVGNISGCPGP